MPLKIVATSDLHGDLPDPRDLPTGDVLVLAGDIFPDDYTPPFRKDQYVGSTRVSRQGWWFDDVLLPWLHNVKHIVPEGKVEGKAIWERRFKHIVMVGGNHDFFLRAMLVGYLQKQLPKNVHYLSESYVELDGVRFFGAGWNMTRGWAFAHDDEDHQEKLRYISPDNIDVMVVHGPPLIEEIDELAVHHCSKDITEFLSKSKVKAYICGHIHEAYGTYKVGNTPVYVVSRKDRNYRDINPFVEIKVED